MRTHILPLILLAVSPARAFADTPTTKPNVTPDRQSLVVSSSAFSAGKEIPPKFTCDGKSTAPPLSWSNVPRGTQSIAVLVDDPDAPKGTFTHWLVTGIPPTATALAEGGKLPQGAVAARNGKGSVGYTGPCPPSGRHRYLFRVFALDTVIPSPRDKDSLLQAIDGHVLAEGELIATYQKITPP
ncbi:MAG: YbhB/YbcL family Raf kinase inhibitor-like protein [Deltaproteobacteria bacterium]|nr:MAG: YbhB/YbcL family Raf kinase inhibitor-like protein [Deltaproteobacteria bacterium]TMQ10579.1 MAG: YbhB/YbcL family Raf kinase inhibitor-like protein [Deltaproteobacteria bacterium]